MQRELNNVDKTPKKNRKQAKDGVCKRVHSIFLRTQTTTRGICMCIVKNWWCCIQKIPIPIGFREVAVSFSQFLFKIIVITILSKFRISYK